VRNRSRPSRISQKIRPSDLKFVAFNLLDI
jgi:hypothetical protein